MEPVLEGNFSTESAGASPRALSFNEVPVVTLSDLDRKIAVIQARVDEIRASYDQLRGPYFWRTAPQEGVQDTLKSMSNTLRDVKVLLYGNTGIYKDAVGVDDRAAVTSRLDTIREIEAECLVLLRSNELLQTMESRNYLGLYASISSMVERLRQIIDPTVTVAQKVQLLREEVTKPAETMAQNSPPLQGLEFYKVRNVAVSKVIDQAVHQSPDEDDTRELSRQKADVIDRVHLQSPALKKELWACQDVQEEEARQVVAGLGTISDKKFSFCADNSWSIWTVIKPIWEWASYTPQSKLHGDTMERELGQPIARLTKHVMRELTQLVGAHVVPDKDEPHAAKLNRYCMCYKFLQRDFEVRYEQIFEKDPDDFFIKLLSYANGLSLALYELANSIEVYKELSSPEALGIFRASFALNAHLHSVAVSSIPALKSFQASISLFHAGHLLTAATYTPHTTTSEFLKHALMSAREVYKRCAPDTLVLTEQETYVWDLVMKKKPLDALYNPNELHASLPISLQTYIVKRITQSLYVAKKDTIDAELELLLFALRQNAKFKACLDSNPTFKAVVDEYERVFGPKRNEELLPEAYEVLTRIFQASDEPKDVRNFARAGYLYSVFTAKFVRIRNQLVVLNELLERNFNERTRARYIPLNWAFHSRVMGSWKDPAVNGGDDFMQELEAAVIHAEKSQVSIQEVSIQELVEAILFKALAYCLYGDMSDAHSVAQEFVLAVLQASAFEEIRQHFSEDIQCLLYENTLNKIISGAFPVGKAEMKSLAEGPITEFLRSDKVPLKYRKIQDALYVLIVKEQAVAGGKYPITDLFIQCKGEVAFKKWLTRYQKVTVATPEHLECAKALQQERKAAFGTPLEDALVGIFGLEQALQWEERVARAAAYTKALV